MNDQKQKSGGAKASIRQAQDMPRQVFESTELHAEIVQRDASR